MSAFTVGSLLIHPPLQPIQRALQQVRSLLARQSINLSFSLMGNKDGTLHPRIVFCGLNNNNKKILYFSSSQPLNRLRKNGPYESAVYSGQQGMGCMYMPVHLFIVLENMCYFVIIVLVFQSKYDINVGQKWGGQHQLGCVIPAFSPRSKSLSLCPFFVLSAYPLKITLNWKIVSCSQ